MNIIKKSLSFYLSLDFVHSIVLAILHQTDVHVHNETIYINVNQHEFYNATI